MDNRPSRLVEVLGAGAPLITGIVAIAGIFVTSWLSQEKWREQFATEHSIVITERRLDLVQRVVVSFNEVGSKMEKIKALRRFGVVASETLVGEDHSMTMDMVAKETSARAQEMEQAMRDLLSLQVLVSAYFENEVESQYMKCMKILEEMNIELKKDMEGQSTAMEEELRAAMQTRNIKHAQQVIFRQMMASSEGHFKELTTEVGILAGKMAIAAIQPM